MKATRLTLEARRVISEMAGDFTTAQVRATAPNVSPAIIGYALRQMRDAGTLVIVSGGEGNYTYRNRPRRASRVRLSPLEAKWRELRASMGSVEIPDYYTTNFEARNS